MLDQIFEKVFKLDWGLGASASHAKYLGLPMFVRRSKKGMFHNIKEKVWKILQLWKNKIVFIGGREVLVKVVVSSIATCAMGSF